MPPPFILGISAYYHDSAAALVAGGDIVAAAQLERFSRRKHDERFPHEAVDYCLREAGIEPSDLAAVVFYDKPIIKFTRVLESFLTVAPAGWRTFPQVLPGWLSEKLDLRGTLRHELPGLSPSCELLFTEHHEAHAASAFYPSPFDEAAILTVDGVGEWATTVIAHGRGSDLALHRELRFPHSLGLLYSAFTIYCGFRVNSGEYKLMGLAPYGEPRYADLIRQHLIDVRDDGSFRLNLDYFDFLRETRTTNDRFHALFGGPPRRPEEPLLERHCDLARSIQVVTEEIMLRLARQARDLTGSRRLCLAGGVALNCVANGRILAERIFDEVWIQPAAGDAGGSLGAALRAWHGHFARDRKAAPASKAPRRDAMQGALLGPEFSDREIQRILDARGARYERLDDDALLDRTVQLLQAEKVVAWFQGRMEFGPRALGNRSILGDPRSPRMQSVMNLKVKFRESFRPFAPAVLREQTREYFDLPVESPYMLLVAPVRPELRQPPPPGLGGLDRLRHPHSPLPAITHVDYTARVQTVGPDDNPRFHALLRRFAAATGCPVLINTSFNVRGEPIVCTPEDAYRCFVHTHIDFLVVGNFVLERVVQPAQALPPKPEFAPD
ncbi:MAG: carbamoyltransferase [Verrucomicrobia bacterium]|nr:carbamoyltransferase [Verrucomicrobiota bacterium]